MIPAIGSRGDREAERSNKGGMSLICLWVREINIMSTVVFVECVACAHLLFQRDASAGTALIVECTRIEV